jgi:hypothetical protein
MSLGSIGPDTKMVILNFSFSSPDDIPEFLLNKEDKRKQMNFVPIKGAEGRCFIRPSDDVSAKLMYDELYFAGYRLVDAYVKERHTQYRTYWVTRYVFVPQDAVGDCAKTVEACSFLNQASEACNEMCRQYFWRVKGYRNPFFKDGHLVHGASCMSIDLESRKLMRDSLPKSYLVINDDKIHLIYR